MDEDPAAAGGNAGTIACPGCGRANPGGFRFCGYCGRPMERPCPTCGEPYPIDFSFCGSCGADLRPEHTPAEAEAPPAQLPIPEHHVEVVPAAAPATAPKEEEVVEAEPPTPPPARLERAPMIDRDGELDLVRSAFDRTRREAIAGLVTLVGAPGIGKTRLAEEFVAQLRSEDSVTVVRGACVAFGEGLTFWPLAQILKADTGIGDGDPPEGILRTAVSRLTERFGSPDEASGIIRILLSSVGVGVEPDPLAGTAPEVARQMILRAWRQYLASLARNGPAVAVIEDLQWADPELLDLIERLTGTMTAPVLFLCTSRPELAERRPEWGPDGEYATTVPVEPLDQDGSRRLLVHLLGGMEVPDEELRSVLERAGGTPFFLEELLRMLIDEGVLVRSEAGWSCPTGLPSTLPETVQGTIAARLERLPEEEQRVLQDASVVGRTFWESAVDRPGAPPVSVALDELMASGLIRERHPSSIEGHRELEFEHPLIREAAYGEIPRPRRGEAHRRALAWLEERIRGRGEEFAEILAHHAEEAGDPGGTARYRLLAGHRRLRLFRAEEAAGRYDRAMEAAGALPEDDAGRVEAEIALARGRAREQLGSLPEAESDYRLAVAKAGDAEGEDGDRSDVGIRARGALGNLLRLQGRLPEGLEAVSEAVSRVSKVESNDLLPGIHHTAGLLRHDAAEWSEALEQFQEGLRAAQSRGDLEGEALNHHGMADTKDFTGPFDEALSHTLRARDLFGTIGQRSRFTHNEQQVGWLSWILGRYPEAEHALDRAARDATQIGGRPSEIAALGGRSLVRLATGRIAGAGADADGAVERGEMLSDPRIQLLARCCRMEVLGEVRAFDRIREDLDRATALSERISTPSERPRLLTVEGWLALERDDRDVATVRFTEGREMAAGSLRDALWSARLEITAVEDRADERDVLAAAAERLHDLARGVSPPFTAWALYGRALAALLGDQPVRAAEDARGAVAQAERLGKRRVLWRALAVLADALHAVGETDQAAERRADAARIVDDIASGIADQDDRRTFLARRVVAMATADRAARWR
jgi:tetratricopeptide (TPR) repeat protein